MTNKEKTTQRTTKLVNYEILSQVKQLNRVLLGDEYNDNEGLIKDVKKNTTHRHKVNRLLIFGKWLGFTGAGGAIVNKWNWIWDKLG